SPACDRSAATTSSAPARPSRTRPAPWSARPPRTSSTGERRHDREPPHRRAPRPRGRGGMTAPALTAGDLLEPQSYRVTRADLVRYAGASGDFNPIHWSDRVATGVGLPGVIAPGMLTMELCSLA